jgi:hypothetical protein
MDTKKQINKCLIMFVKSYILIHLVCLSMTRLGKGVLCSCKFSIVGRMVTTDFE